MSTEASNRHESVIQIAMLLAEKNGYSTDAWRLFEAQADLDHRAPYLARYASAARSTLPWSTGA